MLKDIFRNNILFLLEEQNKKAEDLKSFLELEEIPFIAYVEGYMNHNIRLLKAIASFFEIEFQTLYEPMTDKEYSMFKNEEEKESYLKKLEIFQEELCNRIVDFSKMNLKKVREFKPSSR